ncbi:MAG TPA: amidohydrolase, partial [Burkholderiaceae bacterium]|nr:amidohydrolase [Burkholderiaceae bacterium]
MTSTTSLADLLPDLVALRRDLHAHPEIAFEERRTAGIVAQAMKALGLAVHEGIAGTGVVASLRCGSAARSIALRA